MCFNNEAVSNVASKNTCSWWQRLPIAMQHANQLTNSNTVLYAQPAPHNTFLSAIHADAHTDGRAIRSNLGFSIFPILICSKRWVLNRWPFDEVKEPLNPLRPNCNKNTHVKAWSARTRGKGCLQNKKSCPVQTCYNNLRWMIRSQTDSLKYRYEHNRDALKKTFDPSCITRKNSFKRQCQFLNHPRLLYIWH